MTTLTQKVSTSTPVPARHDFLQKQLDLLALKNEEQGDMQQWSVMLQEEEQSFQSYLQDQNKVVSLTLETQQIEHDASSMIKNAGFISSQDDNKTSSDEIDAPSQLDMSHMETEATDLEQNAFYQPDKKSFEFQKNVALDMLPDFPEPQDAELPYDKSKRCISDELYTYQDTSARFFHKPERYSKRLNCAGLKYRRIFSFYKTLDSQSDEKSTPATYTLVADQNGKVLAQDVVSVWQNNQLEFIWVQHQNGKFSLFSADGNAVCHYQKHYQPIQYVKMIGSGKRKIAFVDAQSIEYQLDYEKSSKQDLSKYYEKFIEKEEKPSSHKLRNFLFSFCVLGALSASYVGATHIFPQLPKVEDILKNPHLQNIKDQLPTKEEIISQFKNAVSLDVQEYRNRNLDMFRGIDQHVDQTVNAIQKGSQTNKIIKLTYLNKQQNMK